MILVIDIHSKIFSWVFAYSFVKNILPIGLNITENLKLDIKNALVIYKISGLKKKLKLNTNPSSLHEIILSSFSIYQEKLNVPPFPFS